MLNDPSLHVQMVEWRKITSGNERWARGSDPHRIQPISGFLVSGTCYHYGTLDSAWELREPNKYPPEAEVELFIFPVVISTVHWEQEEGPSPVS